VNEKLLEVKELSIAFKQSDKQIKAVDAVSFSLFKGECLGIIGESGSGKSLTALSIMRLIQEKDLSFYNGAIDFYTEKGPTDLMQVSLNEMYAWRGKHIGMVFQEPMSSLNPILYCGKQIEEAVRLHESMSSMQAKQRTYELLNLVQIKNEKSVYNAFPHELSGGQKQRVMIAMALAGNPSLLIADEPTTSLDVTVQREILDLLLKLQMNQKMSMLFITHDFGVLANIADRAIVMRNGQVLEENRIDNLLSNPSNDYTKALIGCRVPNDKRYTVLPTLQQNIAGKSIPADERNERHRKIYEKNPLLSIEKLSVKYARRNALMSFNNEQIWALKNVSFNVYPEETFGIVGESGSGKSTLGRSVVGLVNPSNGAIRYNNKNLSTQTSQALRNWRKEIQYVFQDPYSALNPHMSIGEAIMEPLTAHKIKASAEERKKRVLQLMSLVGLQASHFHRLPKEFSGGERQRICIARALALEPQILICDESVSALDVSIQAQIINLLNELKQQLGFSLIFISHDINIVRYVSDRIMVMHNGEVEELNEADELCLNPQKEYTRRLLEAVPKGRVEDFIETQRKKKSILNSHDN
jgi:peptide/nickel transport system ATP-binding protein